MCIIMRLELLHLLSPPCLSRNGVFSVSLVWDVCYRVHQLLIKTSGWVYPQNYTVHTIEHWTDRTGHNLPISWLKERALLSICLILVTFVHNVFVFLDKCDYSGRLLSVSYRLHVGIQDPLNTQHYNDGNAYVSIRNNGGTCHKVHEAIARKFVLDAATHFRLYLYQHEHQGQPSYYSLMSLMTCTIQESSHHYCLY